MNNLSLEAQLIFSCSRYHLSEQDSEKIRSLALSRLDWVKVTRLSQAQRMGPLLQKHLKVAHPEIAQREWYPQFAKKALAMQGRHMFQLAQMIKLQKNLLELGIDALYYKGPILDQMLYGGEHLRLSSDLDLLVHKDDVFVIRDMLLEMGYRPKRAQNQEQEKLLLRRYKDYGFVHPINKHVIEVHWSIVEKQFSTIFDRDFFLSAQHSFELAGVPFSVMNAEEMLVILCVHGALHEWDQLKWLSDVHELIEGTPELDWAKAEEKAHQWKLHKLFYLGLAVCGECLGTVIPEEIRIRTQSNMASDVLKRHIITNYKSIFDGLLNENASTLNRAMYQASLPNGWLAQMRYLWVVVFTTNMNDAHYVSLPFWLAPLHTVLRPFRLVYKWGIGYLASTLIRIFKALAESR